MQHRQAIALHLPTPSQPAEPAGINGFEEMPFFIIIDFVQK
jgi:hypothetical protein